MAKAECEEKVLKREKNKFCANVRNEHVRESLKEDWRAGVRELDQEAAMEQHETNYDPLVELRVE
ncbi:hypothetical protein FRC02_008967 [Tulasnella sp. 418]|nr:hypothetical protein FRC02_008967 [Tulasnella sp. 418]